MCVVGRQKTVFTYICTYAQLRYIHGTRMYVCKYVSALLYLLCRRYPYNIRRQNSGGGGHNALHSYHHHHHSNNNNVGSSPSPAGAGSSAPGYSNHSAGNSPSSLGGHSGSSNNSNAGGAPYAQPAPQSLPLSQHDELIRYIHEAWNKVSQRLVFW